MTALPQQPRTRKLRPSSPHFSERRVLARTNAASADICIEKYIVPQQLTMLYLFDTFRNNYVRKLLENQTVNLAEKS